MYHKPSLSPPVKICLLTVPTCASVVDHFGIVVCHDFLSVRCSLVVTYWERPNLLALLFVMLIFPCGA